MNLFNDTNLLQAVRDAYGLSIPQAICVLIAYQHGTVSSVSAREVLGYDVKGMSSSSALSMPARKKILMEIGKTRVKRGSRPVVIYRVADPHSMYEIIDAAAMRSVRLFQTVAEYEKTAQENLDEAK